MQIVHYLNENSCYKFYLERLFGTTHPFCSIPHPLHVSRLFGLPFLWYLSPCPPTLSECIHM